MRSPLAFLDRLADEHEKALQDGGASATPSGADGASDGLGPAPPFDPGGANGSAPGNGSTPGTTAENVAGSEPNGVAATNGHVSEPATVEASGERAGEGPGAFLAGPDDPSMN